MSIGFEAGNSNDLKLYGKPADVLDHHNTKALCREFHILDGRSGITLNYGFINFNPYSALERLRENLVFLEREHLFVTFDILKN